MLKTESGATNLTKTSLCGGKLKVRCQDGELAEHIAIELAIGVLLKLLWEPKSQQLLSGKNKPTHQRKPKSASNSNKKNQKAMKKKFKVAKAFAEEFLDELEDSEDENNAEDGLEEFDENFHGEIVGYGDDMGALDNVASGGYCVDTSMFETGGESGPMFVPYYGDSRDGGGGTGGFDSDMGFNVDMPTDTDTNMEAFFPDTEVGGYNFEGEY